MVVTTAAVLSGVIGAGAGYAVASNRDAEPVVSNGQQRAPAPYGTPGREDGTQGFGNGPHGFDDDHDGGW